MILFTKEIKDKLIENCNQQDGTKSFKVVCKLFNPSGPGTWYLTELNAEDNVAFGLANIHKKELGYIDISELFSKKYNHVHRYRSNINQNIRKSTAKKILIGVFLIKSLHFES